LLVSSGEVVDVIVHEAFDKAEMSVRLKLPVHVHAPLSIKAPNTCARNTVVRDQVSRDGLVDAGPRLFEFTLVYAL
jgi:hypothetical protein